MNKPILVAWTPRILAPAELISVMVAPGIVSEKTWITALAERVSNMVMAEDKPNELANWACKVLDVPPTREPLYIGDSLVLHNLNLRTWLNCSMEEGWDVEVVASDPEALYAMENCDFAYWVDLAKNYISE